jgi:phosphotransferase system  glucose/maltose/N-acetylglucosamine-specific IIC component
VLTHPQITLSLAIFLAVIVGIGAAVGHLGMGIGAALFALALVAIDATVLEADLEPAGARRTLVRGAPLPQLETSLIVMRPIS